MKFLLSKYQLIKRIDQSVQHGALLKIVDSSGHWGVADVCPFPHLGDLTLEQELFNKGPLFQRAKVLTLTDLQARKNKISLISKQPVENNFLVTNYDINYSHGLNNSFGTIKIKAHSDIASLLNYLKKLPSIKIRLDFNSQLSKDQFSEILKSLNKYLKNIEYIEDPTPWHEGDWQGWNKQVPLALDFPRFDPFKYLNAWTYLIIKPSRQDADHLINQCHLYKKNYTLTSAMDHPVGFSHGFSYAQKFAKNVSGFSTLNYYESTEFDHYFQTENSFVNMKSEKSENEFGIGLTKALENLAWTDYE